MQLYFLLRSLVPGQQIQIESGNYGSWGNYLAKIKTVDKTIHHKNSFISSMASFKTNWRKKNEKSLLKDHIFPKQNLFEAAWKKVRNSRKCGTRHTVNYLFLFWSVSMFFCTFSKELFKDFIFYLERSKVFGRQRRVGLNHHKWIWSFFGKSSRTTEDPGALLPPSVL